MCSRTLTFGPQTVWTQGSTSTAMFIPLGGPVNSNELHSVRASFEFRDSSGDMKVRPAIQYADDPNGTWDTAEPFGPAYSSTEGDTYGTSFVDVTALGTRKLFARLGAVCLNVSATQVELAKVSLRIDIEGSN